jgi:hypothetical protein
MWQYTSINDFMLTKCNHYNPFIVDKIFNRIAAMRLGSWKISINCDVKDALDNMNAINQYYVHMHLLVL